MDEDAVRRDILLAFEYAYLHDDWVFPLADALADVTVQEAVWKPLADAPDARCIWQIVLHMTAWNDNIVQRMTQRNKGELPGKPPEGDWPALPSVLEEAAWEEAQRRLWDALEAIRVHIQAIPLTKMLDCAEVGYSQLADLLCRFTHTAYHLGQITKMREWYALRSA